MRDRTTGSRALLPVFLTVFIDLIGFGIAIPTLAVVLLRPEVGILPLATPFSERTILYGLLVASFSIAQFFGSPILGELSDHYGRKPLFIISLFGGVIGYALFALGILWQRLDLLFLSRILYGFSGGNMGIAFSAIADVSTPEEKSRRFSLVGVAYGLGFILGPVLGSKLADHHLVSWFNVATPFWFSAALTLVNIILFFFLFQETLVTKKRRSLSVFAAVHHIQRALSLKKLRTMFLVVFLLTVGFTFFVQFMPVFLIRTFSFTEADIGVVFAYVGVWIVVSQAVFAGPFSLWYTPESILRWIIPCLCVSYPLVLLAPSSAFLYVLFPFLAVFQGITQPNTTAVVSNLSDDDAQGEVLGINQSVQALGMAIPPLIGGFVGAVHVILPIMFASGMTLLAWLVFLKHFHRRGN